MIYDTHMHCQFSCDSKMTLTEAVVAAAKLGIGIAVTEHWDYDYPTNPEAFTFDLEAYRSVMQEGRCEKVLVGLEIGMQRHTAAADNAVAGSAFLDYVLGAVHCMNGRDLYESSCYFGRTRQEVVEEFLLEATACLEQERDFDSLAHIDYICRYWPFQGEDRELRLQDAPHLFDRLFKLLANSGKSMEINTRRLADPASAAALAKIYKRYAALGGKYCTLGSDAHLQEHVGRGIKQALRLAGECGLRPVYFINRKMHFMEVL